MTRALSRLALAGIVRLSVSAAPGAMRLAGTVQYLQSGQRAPFRGTWTPLEEGVVRQHFEQARGDGTWSTWFDGYYHPVTED